MNILITGISGSGGSYLAEFLLENVPGCRIYGLARWHSTTLLSNLERIKDKIELIECDLNDFSSVIQALKKSKPDYIFHLASHANVRASFITPLSVIQNNVMGTANLLEAVRILEIKPKIQLCSTSEVYGQITEPPVSETKILNPVSPYAVSKATQDMLGYTYFAAYGLPIIRTRMFTYINPRRSDLFATSFALQIARIEQGKQNEIRHGNLNSIRTFIDVRDAMRAYWEILEVGTPGEIYNIGGETTLSVEECLQKLIRMSKCPVPTKLDPELIRPVDVTLQIPDTTKFKTATDWSPRYSLDESLEFLLSECRERVAKE